jgi:hypothetical protein
MPQAWVMAVSLSQRSFWLILWIEKDDNEPSKIEKNAERYKQRAKVSWRQSLSNIGRVNIESYALIDNDRTEEGANATQNK